MMTLTETEMVRQWMVRKGYEPLRSDCRISRSDGTDLWSIARAEVRRWYRDLLETGDCSLVPVEDWANRGLAVENNGHSGLCIALDKECVRPVAVKLKSWRSEARIVLEGSVEARRQSFPYGQGGPDAPVAVRNPLTRQLKLYSLTYEGAAADSLEYLLCVTRELRPEDEDPVYIFDERALPPFERYEV